MRAICPQWRVSYAHVIHISLAGGLEERMIQLPIRCW